MAASQMSSAVCKIRNLLSSGAVTVTGPTQPRILKQKVGSTTVTQTNSTQQSITHQTTIHSNSGIANVINRCYICDEILNSTQTQHQLTEMQTAHSSTKFPNKIGQLVGEGYIVIVSVEDVVCSRCTNLINYLDRIEGDVERMRTNLVNMLNKKYGLYDDGGGGASAPPLKMQKLNSGTGTRTVDDSGDGTRIRKTLINVDSKTQTPGAVQHMKFTTQTTGTNNNNTSTIQRKTARIYKCITCDYKTSDMRLFNTHYETCKQQNFQCKNCKKIFPNFGAMKVHMMRDHNTPMEFTCAVCHINFVNDNALRRHMESNHSTSVVVTSTTNLPPSAVAAVAAGTASVDSGSAAITNTAGSTITLYACTNCPFKSTDKAVFDEHLRKHISGTPPKPKPFKCRLCAQRFESREAATVHAKQHQPSYFKCGTCSMSFSKRDLLVKHFEVHQQEREANSAAVTAVNKQQQQQQQQQQAQQPVVKSEQQSQQQQGLITTQTLLQETIDEALSDSVTAALTNSTNDVSEGTTGNGEQIHFFSCHLCSLTFLQENYYNTHMETHRPNKKGASITPTTTVTSTTSSGVVTVPSGIDAIPSGTTIVSSVGSINCNSNNVSSIVSAASATDGLNKNNSSNTNSTNVGDIESIFEKMHSDKADSTNATSPTDVSSKSKNGNSPGQGTDSSLVITSQEGTAGITFNITIPQSEGGDKTAAKNIAQKKNLSAKNSPVNVGIDMPMLEENGSGKSIKKEFKSELEGCEDDNNGSGTGGVNSGPVSMPSLDDENENQDVNPNDKMKKQKSSGGSAVIKTERDDQQVRSSSTTSAEDNTQHRGSSENVDGSIIKNEQLSPDTTPSNEQQVTMELEEAMQAPVEGGQIKFVLNENGEILQLNNHIITDADGNQILVQDPEHIQQLLQSVGVLQSGDGLDGEATIQMVTDDNGHMILVQGENNTQLIDESLLNADGQLVIQQGQDGELGEGPHVISEDGTRIPVSVSYTADGHPIVQVQQHVMEAAAAAAAAAHAAANEKGNDDVTSGGEHPTSSTNADTGNNTATGRNSGAYFALDLMNQTSEAKAAE